MGQGKHEWEEEDERADVTSVVGGMMSDEQGWVVGGMWGQYLQSKTIYNRGFYVQ